jgi:hypothetical protein
MADENARVEAFDPKKFNESREADKTGKVGGKPSAPATPPAPAPDVAAPVNEPAAPTDADAPQMYQFQVDKETGDRLRGLLGATEEDLTSEALFARIEGALARERQASELLIERGVFDSPQLQSLLKVKEKSDDELVRENYKGMGFTDEEVETQMELLSAGDGVTKAATVIKAKNERDIAAENERLKAEHAKAVQDRISAASEAMSPAKQQQHVQMFEEQLKDVDGIGGVRFGKTDAEATAAKKAHAEYLASGQFERDMKKDPKVYAHMGFLFKNFDLIQETLRTQGMEAGKQVVLSKLQNPETIDRSKAPLPADTKEFDPVKFNQGRAASRNAKS